MARARRLPIRWRLTAWIVTTVVVVVIAAGIAIALQAKHRFVEAIDDTLRRDSAGAAAAIDVFSPELLDVFTQLAEQRLGGSTHAMVLIGPEGVDFAAPAGTSSQTYPLPDMESRPVATLRAAAGTVFEVSSADGRVEYRALTTQLADGRVLVVAAPLVELEDGLKMIGRVLAVVAIVIAVVLAVVIALVSTYITRPIDEMIETAQDIGAGTLHTRLPPSSVAEVDRLAGALNGMLDQLESAFAQRDRSEAALQHFVADASHELRTPLAAIIGYTELHLTKMATGPEQVDRSMQRINAEAERMHHLVEELLTLARLDQLPGTATPATERVDLAAVVSTAVNDAAVISPEHPVTVRADGPAVVVGDPAALRRVFDNLLANVHAHTPGDTATTIEIAVVDGKAVVRVADDGPGIPADQLAHIFDRFYRGDPARARSGGAGLGLAIAAKTIERHRGTLTASNREQGGAVFEVSLPLA